MPNEPCRVSFQSILAPVIEKFLEEKRACGYGYHEPARVLQTLDRFCLGKGLTSCELTRFTAREWLALKPHESAGTHLARVTVLRQFSKFLCRVGYSAYVPDTGLALRQTFSFSPRLLTQEETRKLIQAVNALPATARSPLRHLIMPEVFRLLCGCGFRVGEVLNLRVGDVDLDKGVITVRQGKFRKDRLAPPALPLVDRWRTYAAGFGKRPREAVFFPAPKGRPYRLRSVYGLFRRLLLVCHITHGGRSKGPRVHDLRHGFAVNTLLRWYRNGEDLDAKLPLLAVYLGHQSLAGTQRYLHLTAELFPEITTRVEALFGDVIPRRKP